MKTKKYIILVCTLLLILFHACQKEDIVIRVVTPSCENKIDPLGIDVLNPHLSWKLESTFRNKKQSAYQILVSSSEDDLVQNVGNLWDTEKINSDKSIQIRYKGKKLSSEMVCYWKVRVWDEEGNISD